MFERLVSEDLEEFRVDLLHGVSRSQALQEFELLSVAQGRSQPLQRHEQQVPHLEALVAWLDTQQPRAMKCTASPPTFWPWPVQTRGRTFERCSAPSEAGQPDFPAT